MGNAHHRHTQDRDNHHRDSQNEGHRRLNSSQFSLSNFVGNLSGRSFVSLSSNHSVYSTSRPWSRVSRRRWNDNTLSNPLEASKTAWPVANKESIFLPEFPITTELVQKDFELGDLIAKGAFGEVRKVNRVSEDKVYALKVLSKAKIVSENAVRQVKEEVRIQEVCGHHNYIVGSVSRWQTKKRLYIVSEYISGGELLELLDKYNKFPEELVKIFVAEIAVALDFLHNAGVIYRDLKPENILLDADGHIQLIDFGLSKWLSIGSRTSTICGTLKYIAPEVLSREPYNHAVDWWSLGVLSCRMLTGEFPAPVVGNADKSDSEKIEGQEESLIDNDTVPNTQIKVPGTLPDSSVTLSSAARALLLRLLERDPGLRMRNLRQMQQSAFYMGYDFAKVKAKKILPRIVLEENIPQMINSTRNSHELFDTFDGITLV